jgi:hypothetical protein
MAKALHIIVTCTNRKRVQVKDELRASRLPAGPVSLRANEWAARLARSADDRVAVRDLYCGEHWQQALHMVTRAAVHGWSPTLWVASAGHGLLSLDEEIPAYAATFAPYESDAVAKTQSDAVTWWGWLCTYRRRYGVVASSIERLVAADPEADYLLVLSGSYLEALDEDLGRAAAHLLRPESMIVVCAGASGHFADRGYVTRPSVRLQGVLGGARQALNVRTAAWLLGQLSPETFRVSLAAGLLGILAADAPELVKHNRIEQNDEQVRALIETWCEEDPGMSASRLLRTLRDRGFACEQMRFRRLFRSVTEGGRDVR